MRAEALAQKLAARDMNGYWNSVKDLSVKSTKITNKLDKANGEKEIVNLWKDKYKKLFNSVDVVSKHEELFLKDELITVIL